MPAGRLSAPSELETTLATLVRGTPFEANPLLWAEPYAREATNFADVAHTLATWRDTP